MHVRTPIIALALLFLPGSFAPGQQGSGNSGLDAAKLARIPERVREFVRDGEVSGAVTLVARHHVVAEFDAVGSRDMEHDKPMAKDTIFQIMSMTKPITGVGIMMLMEEGKLALTDPVERHLPEFRGQMVIDSRGPDGSITLRRPSRPITIRDLMTHTAGMFDSQPPALAKFNARMNRTLADAVSIFSQQPLLFEPGTRWQYSSPGIGVLGRIIEVASGQKYEEFLAERLFRPLGMKDSFFFLPADRIDRVAMVYKKQDGKLLPAGDEILGGDPALHRKGAIYPAPEWGLYSTASDLLAFYDMMLSRGTRGGKRYLSSATVELMTAVHTGSIPNSGWLPNGTYGLTWEVVSTPEATLTGHSLGTYGHGGAFGTQGWIDPKRDLVRILMLQRSGGDDLVRDSFLGISTGAILD